MTTAVNEIPNWHLEADYVESCNCDYGCPATLMDSHRMAFAVL